MVLVSHTQLPSSPYSFASLINTTVILPFILPFTLPRPSPGLTVAAVEGLSEPERAALSEALEQGDRTSLGATKSETLLLARLPVTPVLAWGARTGGAGAGVRSGAAAGAGASGAADAGVGGALVAGVAQGTARVEHVSAAGLQSEGLLWRPPSHFAGLDDVLPHVLSVRFVAPERCESELVRALGVKQMM
jgi:hypothetical protein